MYVYCASKSFSPVVDFVSFFFNPPPFVSPSQSSDALSTQLATLMSEKAELVQSLSKVEAELAVRVVELEQVQTSLATERESGVKTAETLQNQLNDKVKRCHFRCNTSSRHFSTK